MNRRELEDNPFFVLGVPASASRMEVERAGQKLLAQLAIESESAKRYRTPFGARERDEAKLRAALAALRDPERRLLHELWAGALEPARAEQDLAPPAPAWAEAFRSIGWRGPCPG